MEEQQQSIIIFLFFIFTCHVLFTLSTTVCYYVLHMVHDMISVYNINVYIYGCMHHTGWYMYVL